MSELKWTRRPATNDDDVYVRGWVVEREDYSAFPLPLKTQLEETQWRGWCAGLRALPNAETSIIELENRPVGVLLLRRGVASTRILDVIITQAQRSRGLGTTVLRSLQKSEPSLELSVRLESPARRLYERLGFEEVGSDDVDLQLRWSP